jgi:hypothetical protein
MQINTKYEIGQHVWHIYENKGEACVFDDFIGWITIEDEMYYTLKESTIDIKEEDIILYEDTDTLLKKIVEIMEDIRNKEQLDK